MAGIDNELWQNYPLGTTLACLPHVGAFQDWFDRKIFRLGLPGYNI